MSYLELLKLSAPEAIIVVTALIVLTIGLISPRTSKFCPILAAFGIAAAVVALLRLPQHANLFGGMLVISPLNSLFKIICLVTALTTIPIAASEKSLRNQSEYLAMLLLGSVGLMLLVGSEELLMIFIGLELLSLPLYVMAAFDKTDLRSSEAGLKYFLFGSVASAFTLFGISFIYGMSGTTALAAVAQKFAAGDGQPLLIVGIVMTLVGFGFKITAAPFHLWAPDVYQGAPIPSAAFIASGSKVASFVVLGKIVLVGFGPVRGSADWHAMIAGWSPVLAALAALSILLGNFVALAQTNVRRLLAYSAVDAMDFPRRSFTLASTQSHSSVRSRSSARFGTRVAVTIYKISPVSPPVRHYWRQRWRSFSCRLPVCHRLPDFSVSSTCSAPRFAPAAIMDCFGW
jgi:NADH-quinone oxidoreductase subunit N